MNATKVMCAVLILLFAAIAPRVATADDPANQGTTSATAPIEITIDQAKEMILDFISAEESKEKKAGVKKPFFITASRPILEKREMVRDDKDGNLFWGPWQVYPQRRLATLHADLKEGQMVAWEVTAQIKQVEGKYRLTEAKVLEIRGPIKIGPAKPKPSSK